MKFDCREIAINDEDLGCTVTFSEEVGKGLSQIDGSIDEIIASTKGQYILLQRTYPEDEIERDHFYVETSNPDKAGELKDFSIELFRSRFLMSYQNEIYDLSIQVSDNEFKNLIKALKIIINKRGQFIIHD